MKMGTKSLLYGVHQVALHPLFVAIAWRKLYGRWPRDPRVWLAFIVHDWGYWGCPNMDGPEGKAHPYRAAFWFAVLFDRYPRRKTTVQYSGLDVWSRIRLGPWGKFCLYHSRSLARRDSKGVSKLCAPDKLGAFLMPRWLYLRLARWTGELDEYMAEADTPSGRAAGISTECPEAWYDSVKAYLEGVSARIVAGGEPGVPPSRSEQ